MSINIDQLKKKIIYRSNYRGTKEMDKLLSTFTKKNINDLNYKVSMNYYGDHKDIDSSTYQTIDKDSITTFDLELNQTMENKMFYLGLYNITDEKYEQPDGYNQLGFNFQAGIRITM